MMELEKCAGSLQEELNEQDKILDEKMINEETTTLTYLCTALLTIVCC